MSEGDEPKDEELETDPEDLSSNTQESQQKELELSNFSDEALREQVLAVPPHGFRVLSEIIHKLDVDESQYDISQETADAIVSKIIEVAENSPRVGVAYKNLTSLNRDIWNPSVDFTSKAEKSKNPDRYEIEKLAERIIYFTAPRPSTRNFKRENIQDKIFRSLIKYAKTGEHFETVRILFDHYLNDVHMIKPEVLYQGAAELNWAQKNNLTQDQLDASSYHLQNLIGWMVYDTRFASSKLSSYFEKLMESESEENFGEISKALELVRIIFRRTLGDDSYAFENYRTIRTEVEKIAQKSKSYLVSQRAHSILEEMSSFQIAHYQDFEDEPDAGIEIHKQRVDRWLSEDIWRNKIEDLAPLGPRNGFICASLSPSLVGIYDYHGQLSMFAERSALEKRKRGENINLQAQEELPVYISGKSRESDTDDNDDFDDFADFALLLSLPVREQIQRDFGVNLSELEIPVQFEFLRFVKEKSEDQAKETIKFLKDFGPDAMTSFLSLEGGASMSEIIDALTKKLDPETAKIVLEKFSQAIERINQIKEYLASNLQKNVDDSDIEETSRTLLSRGIEILNLTIRDDVMPEDIKRILDNYNSEILAFAATFKSLKSDGEQIQLEDFVKFTLQVCQGEEISRSDADQMKIMIVRNRMDRADISEQAQKEFDEALQSPDSKFYILKLDGHLIGFFRVDSMSETDAYLGSLNVPPEVQGAGIGDEILKRFFIHALNGRVGHATADPRNRVTPKYIGRYNFVGSGVKPFGDSGRNFIEMTLNPQINAGLEFFGLLDEQIAQRHQTNDFDLEKDNQIILRLPSTELETLMSNAQTILSDNRFVMSAYRRRIEGGQEVIYMGFELNPLADNH